MRPDAVSDPTPAPGAGPALARASVDVGPIRTSYVRAGSGAPVVLLSTPPDDAGAGVPLLAVLATRFRVVAPEPRATAAEAPGDPAPAPAFSAWLRGFLDGMGIARASLVAREEFALRALSFCLTDPLRVDRLVLFYRDATDPAVCAAAAPDSLGGTGHPLLVRREPTSEEAADVDDVLRFLLGEDVAPSLASTTKG